MPEQVARKIGGWIEYHRPEIVDITGGAPELNPWFKYFVELAHGLGLKVMDRNNLTIIEEPGFEDLPSFLAANHVEVIASLPCYLERNVARQRGQGVFEKSIRALKKLNAVGYGGNLTLHLVYNPLGPNLAPNQQELEREYKEVLEGQYGIRFNHLFTLNNQPIARFADDLRSQGAWDDYLELLANSFNPQTVGNLMCKDTLSVGYGGEIYDCDFNQMLELHLKKEHLLYLWDIQPDELRGTRIHTGDHCLACTAGAGSSCTGALAA